MDAYIAKDKKDPGLMGMGKPVEDVVPRIASDRELLIRICEKLGVPID